jgi:hypothetical protein
MAENAPILPDLSPVARKLVHITFDGGRLTSDAGVLLLAERPFAKSDPGRDCRRTERAQCADGTVNLGRDGLPADRKAATGSA